MIKNQKLPPAHVIGPLSESLTWDSPPADTTRRILLLKAEAVAAVIGGLLCIYDVCEHRDLTLEEFITWQRVTFHETFVVCLTPPYYFQVFRTQTL